MTGEKWFKSQGWKLFEFQKEAWQSYKDGYNGIINAPTGSGKTYSLLIPAIENYKQRSRINSDSSKGLQILWITPIRALAKEIAISSDRAAIALGVNWRCEIRTGDTSQTNKLKQWKSPPEMLVTTPESIHVMFTKKGYRPFFSNLQCIIIDEWHELIGSKRGVQTELLISRLRALSSYVKVWAISATIGNSSESLNVLLGMHPPEKVKIIKSSLVKRIEIRTVIPNAIERFPWAGHLGLSMIDNILRIISDSKTALIFTNTRAQSEIWYHRILEKDPNLAGLIAIHHGSISREVRDWVEESLYKGNLKAVVCTSSLDLGVDFRPVDKVIQIGSPKGIARFLQRAGRSGHSPGKTSEVFFVPTNTLELLESASIKDAINENIVESRIPYIRSFDVLIQYLMTLACSVGFYSTEILKEIRGTYSYFSITDHEWDQVLSFLIHGSEALKAYDNYARIGLDQNGKFRAVSKSSIIRHKMGIGTITSASMMQVKYKKGRSLGSVEEYFISMLSPGEVFWFAGRSLEVIRIKDMEVHVVNAKSKNARIASYMGGRMPFSSKLAHLVRENLYQYLDNIKNSEDMVAISPLLETQKERSIIANKDQLLVEYFKSKEGYHLIVFPIEGRNVHEGLAALVAKRISMMLPISFSIAVNDFGFELLSDIELDIESVITHDIFSLKNLNSDILASINSVEMAKRRFRDIARISGLIFQGFPGKKKKEKHLQSSSQLLFEVFKDYDPNNILYLQAYEEVMTFQLEEYRLRKTLKRIENQEIVIVRPIQYTPFSFPLMVDRLREKMSSETLQHRIEKMKLDIIK